MFTTTIHQIWLEGEADLSQYHSELYQNVVKMRKLHNNHTRLWSAEMIEKLIEDDYPHLIATYRSYQHPRFRMEFAKYVILHKCGGFVVDIDCKPKKCLYELLRAKDLHRHFLPLVVNDTDPYKCRSSKKYINTFCIFMPYAEHPLMRLVLTEIVKTAKRRPFECHLAYLLRSVGAYFLTACIKKYKKQTQRELNRPVHKEMINDMVRSYSDMHAREPSLSKSLSWSSLSDSMSRSELKGKVHTQDVVNLEPAHKVDFFLYHNDHNIWLGEDWETSMKRRKKAKLGGAQIAVIAVCVGVLVAVFWIMRVQCTQLSQQVSDCQSVNDIVQIIKTKDIVDTNDMKQFVLTQIQKKSKEIQYAESDESMEQTRDIPSNRRLIRNSNATKFILPRSNKSKKRRKLGHAVSINSRKAFRQIIIDNILDFVCITDYHRICLISQKWNRSLLHHKRIYMFYELHFGSHFKEICNGKPFQIKKVNHRQRRLSLQLDDNYDRQQSQELRVPHFERCRKWTIYPSPNHYENYRIQPMQLAQSEPSIFQNSVFLRSFKFRRANIYKLEVNPFILSRLQHLQISDFVGLPILHQISLLKWPNLRCLELLNANIAGEQDEDEEEKSETTCIGIGIPFILNKILSQTVHLLCFKFEAKNSSLNLKFNANQSEKKYIKLPPSIQFISLSKFINYFHVDLTQNSNIIGLHLRDIALIPESILWPKAGLLQCLTIESYTGWNTRYVEQWNRYIYCNKHELACVRFIKFIGKQYERLLCVENQVNYIRNMEQIAHYAELQDMHMNLGAINNPYMLTPMYIDDRIKIKIKRYAKTRRLFQILINIADCDQVDAQFYAKFLLQMTELRWIARFGLPSMTPSFSSVV